MALITTSKRDVTALKNAQSAAVKASMASELNETPRGKFWVAVHDGVKVLRLPFFSDGITKTSQKLIICDGPDGKVQCNEEIRKLGLDTKAVDEQATHVGQS